ncbi:hypothetical protein PG999_005439 [Apiospora kogelbergensis]|uniref:Heterokaryon incompatibility domain-containing protein n=1 Tax=Apiospora kogelbergensis TaxID=1337665 RepID=A0AAW0R237_9PEZI
MTYLYNPIQSNQIRLLRFLQDETQISAALEIFSLDDHLPKYYTLSYTWACDQAVLARSWSLLIGQQQLLVLDSLKPFVQALRARDLLLSGRRWWIDSICIDQGNLEERGQQVQLMHQIYSRAADVVVWLGDHSVNSSLAISFIRHLDKIYLQNYSVHDIRTMLQKEEYKSQWAALTNLLARKWWTRVWTIQEFVMPPSLSFWCGKEDVSRVAMCNSLSVADKCKSTGITETLGFRHGFSRRRACVLYRAEQEQEPNPRRSLVSLAAYFCSSDATDDRDRLYGLRALSTDGGSLLEVNYSITSEEVYTRFAKAFIQHSRSLDIICFASVFSAPPGSGCPSWVPDWRKRGELLVVPVMVSQSSNTNIGNLRAPHYLDYDPSVYYTASQQRKAEYTFRGSLLLARGAIIDRVDGVAGSEGSGLVQSLEGNSASSPDGLSSSGRSATDILRSVCRCLVLDRRDRFLRYPMPTDEFLGDFVRLCTPLLHEAHGSAPKALQEWFHLTRPLRIDGRSFETTLRDGHRLFADFRGPAPNQDEFYHDSFFGRFYETVVRMTLRLIVSRKGRVGMASHKAREGDFLCVLYGCSVPVLLRKSDNGLPHTFVGECFLDGCMDGSALEQDDGLSEETFCIQ